MRWEDERYVRLYTRKTVTYKLLPWQGKALLSLILKEADRAGVIDLDSVDPVDAICALTDMPPEVVAPGLSALMKAGVVQVGPAMLVLPKFIEAQEAPSSDAQRKRDQRERERDLALREVTNPGVTKRDKKSRTVTNGHAESQPVTPNRAVPPVPSEPLEDSPQKAAEAAGWRSLIEVLFSDFKALRGYEPKPLMKDFAALKRLRKRVGNDAELRARWGRGLGAQYKQRVDCFSDLDSKWDGLGADPPKPAERDWKKGRVGAEEIDQLKLVAGDQTSDF